MQKEHHGFLHGILAAVFYSLMILCVKLAKESPVAVTVFIRFLIGLLFLLPTLLKKRFRFRVHHLRKHLVRDLSGVVALYCFFYAAEQIPLVNATTLANTGPLFVPLVILIVLKQLIPKKRMLGLCLGFVGVLVVLRPTGATLQWADLIGLMSGLFVAIAVVFLRQLSKVESASSILSLYFIVSTFCSFPFAVWTFRSFEEQVVWIYLVCIGILGTLYQYFLTKAYTHAPASKVSATAYLGVVFSGLLGWLVLGEVPSKWSLAGIALIIAGGLIVVLDREKPRFFGRGV